VLAHLALPGLVAGFEFDKNSLTELYTSGGLLLALTVLRLSGFTVAKRLRCRAGMKDLAVIIGAGHVGIQLGRNLQRHPEYGVEPVGYLDLNPRVNQDEELPAPLLGAHEHLATVIQDFNVVYVIVAFGGVREEALVDILRTCDRLDVDVLVVPRLFELHNSNRSTDDIWGIPLTRVRRAAFRRPGWRAKRAMDVVLSAGALLALAPVLAVCALAVRLEAAQMIRLGMPVPSALRRFRCVRRGVSGHLGARGVCARRRDVQEAPRGEPGMGGRAPLCPRSVRALHPSRRQSTLP
jgi:hypothetical protein